ncbi:MAG: dUTP diphosphatase [Patescibacteria group bacterium]|nr:dUTP diphosphatase [Patescibacteria group bacterium]
MNVKIKRFDKHLPLPEYKTEGAAGFDLYSRLEMKVPAQTIAYIPLNIAMQLPQGYWALLAARSSLHKKGLMLANGIGIGDYDYRGDEDEYKAAVFNFSQDEVVVEKGERIAQMLILPIEKAKFEELSVFETENRGGFGSTGKK